MFTGGLFIGDKFQVIGNLRTGTIIASSRFYTQVWGILINCDSPQNMKSSRRVILRRLYLLRLSLAPWAVSPVVILPVVDQGKAGMLVESRVRDGQDQGRVAMRNYAASRRV